MAVDPKKLKAFAEDPTDDEDLDDEDMEDEEPEEEEEEPEEESAAPKLDHDAFVELLGKFGSDIQNSVDELDRDQLKNPTKPMPSTDQLILMQGFHDLDDELNAAMRDYGEIKPSEANEIAAELFDEKSVEDPYTFAGWLVRASKIAKDWQSSDEQEAAKAEAEAPKDEEEPEEEPASGGKGGKVDPAALKKAQADIEKIIDEVYGKAS